MVQVRGTRYVAQVYSTSYLVLVHRYIRVAATSYGVYIQVLPLGYVMVETEEKRLQRREKEMKREKCTPVFFREYVESWKKPLHVPYARKKADATV